MGDLTRDQVAAMEQEALRVAAVQDDVERAGQYEAFAAMCAQLLRYMDAAGSLRGVQIWTTVEKILMREKGHAGALGVVVPRRGTAGAGIGLFNLVEAARLHLPESRRAFLADIAAGAYETAMAQAEVAPQHPNGGTDA